MPYENHEPSAGFSLSLTRSIKHPHRTLFKKITVDYKGDPIGGRLNYFQTRLKILRVEMLVVTSASTASKLLRKSCSYKFRVSVVGSAKKEAKSLQLTLFCPLLSLQLL